MENNSLVILGIDPGNKTGISILYLDVKTLKITKIETKTIILDRFVDNDDLVYRLIFVKSVINDIYNFYKPNCLSMESAFLNSKYPKAVIQLSQYVGMIESAFLEIDPTFTIFKYPPMYIKSVCSGSGTANKDDMRIAIKKNKELSKLLNIDSMSEHEIDATFIAYTAIEEIRKYNYILLAMVK